MKNKYMKNKKVLSKVVLAIAICIIMILCLVFKANSLNNVEKQVYDKMIYFVGKREFFNPKEARLLDVIVKYEYIDEYRSYSKSIETFYIKVLGTNKVGGTLNKCYRIYYDDYEWDSYDVQCDDIYKTGLGYEQLSTKSIGKINKALRKYWNSLGL